MVAAPYQVGTIKNFDIHKSNAVKWIFNALLN